MLPNDRQELYDFAFWQLLCRRAGYHNSYRQFLQRNHTDHDDLLPKCAEHGRCELGCKSLKCARTSLDMPEDSWLIGWLRWLRFIGKVNWINQHIEHHQARCATKDHDNGFCACTDVSLGRSPCHFTKLKFGIEILKIQVRRWVVIADCVFFLEYDRCTLFDFLKYIYFLFASSHLHHKSI